jgi:hypothetical protein
LTSIRYFAILFLNKFAEEVFSVGKPAEVRLSQEAIDTINEILSRRRSVEISFYNGELQIWERSSKRKYEASVRGQG